MHNCMYAGGLQLQGQRVRLLPRPSHPEDRSGRNRVRLRGFRIRLLSRRHRRSRRKRLRRLRLSARCAAAGRLRRGKGPRPGKKLHHSLVLWPSIRRMFQVRVFPIRQTWENEYSENNYIFYLSFVRSFIHSLAYSSLTKVLLRRWRRQRQQFRDEGVLRIRLRGSRRQRRLRLTPSSRPVRGLLPALRLRRGVQDLQAVRLRRMSGKQQQIQGWARMRSRLFGCGGRFFGRGELPINESFIRFIHF